MPVSFKQVSSENYQNLENWLTRQDSLQQPLTLTSDHGVGLIYMELRSDGENSMSVSYSDLSNYLSPVHYFGVGDFTPSQNKAQVFQVIVGDDPTVTMIPRFALVAIEYSLNGMVGQNPTILSDTQFCLFAKDEASRWQDVEVSVTEGDWNNDGINDQMVVFKLDGNILKAYWASLEYFQAYSFDNEENTSIVDQN